MGLIRSNKYTDTKYQPKKMVTVDDIEKTEKKPNEVKPPKEVTFNTNLKISNHTRNKLQALMTLGYTASQKDAIDFLFENYLQQLNDEDLRELKLQIKTLEKRDAKLKH